MSARQAVLKAVRDLKDDEWYARYGHALWPCLNETEFDKAVSELVSEGVLEIEDVYIQGMTVPVMRMRRS